MALVAIMALGISGCQTTSKEKLKVYNWGSYIDKKVIKEFEQEYGVKVVYDEFEQNEDLYTKVAKSAVNYDVVVPSDYMIDRLIQEGFLAKLDKTKLSSFNEIADKYLSPIYDKNNDYSIPYMVGTTGILYNKNMVSRPPTSWEDMWNPEYTKNVLMWNSMRDTLSVGKLLLGYSVNTEDEGELQAVKEKLIEQRPMVQAYAGDEMQDKMIAGEAAMAFMYSGDAVYCMSENEDLDYVVPKEGGNKWVDAWVILESSASKDLAHKFIDFMCRPDIAARNMDYTGYTSGIEAAWEDFDLEDEVMFPPADVLARCEVFLYSPTALQKYIDTWTEIKTGYKAIR